MTNAAALRALHVPGQPLLLPNAWDVASAEAVVAAGLPAVATSSVAVAEALGFGDGEQLPVDLLFVILTAIANAVAVPVTADLERGYGLPPRELVQRLAEAGVVGCNLEDSEPRTGVLVEPQHQADLLSAVRQAAGEQGWDLVINARIDAAMQRPGDPERQLDECLARAASYSAADCVYPILLDTSAVSRFVQHSGLPVNVLAGDLAELTTAGVARISWGAGVWRTQPDERPALLASIVADGCVEATFLCHD